MQNEFEKQVRQKMEELKLAPSDPVWQKVEMQIRGRKDRRRLVIWLPLSVLILGAGLWLVIGRQPEKLSYNKTQQPVQKPALPHNTERKINNAAGNSVKATTNKAIESQQKMIVPDHRENKIHSTPSDKPVPFDEPFASHASPKKFTGKQRNWPAVNKKAQHKTRDIVSSDSEIPEENFEKPGKTERIDSTSVFSNEAVTVNTKDSTEGKTAVSKTDSIRKDTAVLTKPAVKKAVAAKWKFSVASSAGVAGSGRMNVFNGMRDSASRGTAYNSGSPGGVGQGNGSSGNGTSGVKKGWAFSIAVLAKKELNERTRIAAGLQYNYYSNTVKVGNRITQSTVIRDYSVSQYYSNSVSTTRQPYTNHYHFISLPLCVERQLVKGAPFDLHIGLSLQYLVQTNALVFDDYSKAYFNTKKAFNGLQLFSEAGLNYAVPLGKNAIALGPIVQYGLSRLEKKNPDRHLFSYGLKAQLELNKN